jgi:hypothetical protein
LIFLFYYIHYLILINEQISPSKDGLRAQAVHDLAEIMDNKIKEKSSKTTDIFEHFYYKIDVIINNK